MPIHEAGDSKSHALAIGSSDLRPTRAELNRCHSTHINAPPSIGPLCEPGYSETARDKHAEPNAAIGPFRQSQNET